MCDKTNFFVKGASCTIQPAFVSMSTCHPSLAIKHTSVSLDVNMVCNAHNTFSNEHKYMWWSKVGDSNNTIRDTKP